MITLALDEIVYFLGFLLLYIPPLFIWSFKDYLKNLRIFHKRYLIHFASYPFVFLMMYLIPEAIFAFAFYFLTFNFIYALYLTLFKDGFEAFSVSIYSCFAISVLWEFPIQIMIPQNPYALVMSSFKALGIIFLVLTLRKRWYRLVRVGNFTFPFLITTIAMGIALTNCLTFYSTYDLYWVLHLYRLPWLILIFAMIVETYMYKPITTNYQS